MKRTVTLFLILALALALLTSCELMAPGPTQRPSIGLPGGPSETDELTPAETADPTVDEYGFTIFPEGNYLADPKFDTDGFLPDYDANPSFIHFLSTSIDALCSTEDTVYSCVGGTVGTGPHIINFMDKASGIRSVLCGKPECPHNDSSCNAYVTQYAAGLRVYDGKLYWIENDSKIVRMDPDGTDRETVNSVWGGAYNHINGNPTVVLHRGYVYYAGVRHELVIDGHPMCSVTINVQSINGKEGFTLLDKLVDAYTTDCLIKPVGNDLYIMLYSADYEDRKNGEGLSCNIELYCWDSASRQVEHIYSRHGSPEDIKFERMSFLPVPGDGIYLQSYALAKEDAPGFYRSSTQYVCKYSFAHGDLEMLQQFETKGDQLFRSPYYTSDLIIVTSAVHYPDDRFERMVYAYDYKGSLVLNKYMGEHGFGNFMGADDEFIYFFCIEANTSHYIAVPLDGGDVIVIG